MGKDASEGWATAEHENVRAAATTAALGGEGDSRAARGALREPRAASHGQSWPRSFVRLGFDAAALFPGLLLRSSAFTPALPARGVSRAPRRPHRETGGLGVKLTIHDNAGRRGGSHRRSAHLIRHCRHRAARLPSGERENDGDGL